MNAAVLLLHSNGIPARQRLLQADAGALQAMRRSGSQWQRACACGGGCPRCLAGTAPAHQRLQAKHFPAGETGLGVAPETVRDVLHSPGQSLDAQTRSSMGSRFGYDFGGVRVHTGDRPSESALLIGARAYTAGRDIVFGEGQDTHSWQYQHGISVSTTLYHAIAGKYDYGGEDGLKEAHEAGEEFTDFNTEQQGDITRDYYRALVSGGDVSAFKPFIDEIQGT
jgi:hypothetical protein